MPANISVQNEGAPKSIILTQKRAHNAITFVKTYEEKHASEQWVKTFNISVGIIIIMKVYYIEGFVYIMRSYNPIETPISRNRKVKVYQVRFCVYMA